MKKEIGERKIQKTKKKEIVKLKQRGWENQMVRERQERKKQR